MAESVSQVTTTPTSLEASQTAASGTSNELSKTKIKTISDEKIYDTVVSSGQSALNAFLTMNGGASIAFLTFIGSLIEKHSLPKESSDDFTTALQMYIGGTFMAVCGFGAIFLTNCLAHIKKYFFKDIMFKFTLAFGFASLLLFVLGSLSAINALGRIDLSTLPATSTKSP